MGWPEAAVIISIICCLSPLITIVGYIMFVMLLSKFL